MMYQTLEDVGRLLHDLAASSECVWREGACKHPYRPDRSPTALRAQRPSVCCICASATLPITLGLCASSQSSTYLLHCLLVVVTRNAAAPPSHLQHKSRTATWIAYQRTSGTAAGQ